MDSPVTFESNTVLISGWSAHTLRNRKSSVRIPVSDDLQWAYPPRPPHRREGYDATPTHRIGNPLLEWVGQLATTRPGIHDHEAS